MTQNQTDLLLEETVEKFGNHVRSTLVKIQELVDQYVNMPFDSRKVSQKDISESFELLHRIYNTTLNNTPEQALAGIQYLVKRIAKDRHGAFNAIRMNMAPNVEKGGSKTSLRFVTDLNQLFANLANSANANQLRSRIRIEPILANVRSTAQRENINQYIASIDY